MTADAKRHTTAAIDLSPDQAEEDMYEEYAQDDDDDGDDEQPPWAKRQEERMMEKFVAIMRSSSDDLKTEIAQINLKVDMAQATADAAHDKADQLIHRVKSAESNQITMDQVMQKIDEAFKKFKDEHKQGSPHAATAATSSVTRYGEDAEKFSRTMVVGGFPQDSDRDQVTKWINDQMIDEKDDTVDEIYAYMYGSIGFVRFQTAALMKDYLKKSGLKEKLKFGEKEIWTTASKSPDERRKARHLGKHKKVLIEVGLAKTEDVKVDYRRGLLLIKRVRVGEWIGSAGDGSLDLNENGLKKVGIDVGKVALQKAVRELLNE